MGVGDELDDDLGVGGGLEDGSVFFEAGAGVAKVGEVPVVGDGHPPDDFRSEVREWLAASFAASLKGKGNALASVEGPTQETPEATAIAIDSGSATIATVSAASTSLRKWPRLYPSASTVASFGR